jgi:hypothetical protein
LQEPKTKTPKEFLKRYTNLPALIHMLTTQKITLLSPNKWDDRNDAHFMNEYKNLCRDKTLLALCFAETSETYHHWRVFSNGMDGVCIDFDKEDLCRELCEYEGVRCARVEYHLISDLRNKPLKRDTLPFLKRYPYEAEKEFRFIYTDSAKEYETRDFPFDLKLIKRVTINPWMPKPLAKSVKKLICQIPECEKLPVFRSTLTGNTEWQDFVKQVAIED